MKPIIGILTNDDRSAMLYKAQLSKIFHHGVILQMNTRESQNLDRLNSDLYITSTEDLLELASYCSENSDQVILMDLSYSEESLKIIDSMNYGQPILLVNYNRHMAEDSMQKLMLHYPNKLKLLPYYPEMSTPPTASIAITPGEIDLVPKIAEEVIDIGHRILSMNTILSLINKLFEMGHIDESSMNEYYLRALNQDHSYRSTFVDQIKTRSQLSIFLNQKEKGLVYYNQYGGIQYVNDKAESIFNWRGGGSDRVDGLQIALRGIDFSSVRFYMNLNRLINGTWYEISIYELSYIGEAQEYLCVFDLLGKAHVRKKRSEYGFEDIIQNSSKMSEIINNAKQISQLDSAIFLTGESGTGKGILAQAIHNHSFRSKGPFFAVNASTIPEALMESELFGYEEGAFTGASKGGKKGYFEFVNQGTLFLDEIDGMSLSLQAKILKVIEEKSFRKISGSKEISTDFRLITATNKSLQEILDGQIIRRDLYYRIAVFSLQLPPIRERESDVLILLDHFIKQFKLSISLTRDAKRLLLGYPWLGNVREIHNFAERLRLFDGKIIGAGDLLTSPVFYDMDFIIKGEMQSSDRHEPEMARAVLQLLYDQYMRDQKIGFQRLFRLLNDRGMEISKNKLQKILQQFVVDGMVTISIGRGGTQITERGIQMVLEES
ncbi:MAG: sigma 54-interacting transcriptional regulator [Tissierellia bacterium]|nr:sigma 54-interacting transcriptional regulator [Tissierellia bacterium]